MLFGSASRRGTHAVRAVALSLLLPFLALFAGPAHAQSPSLLADLNPGSAFSGPSEFVQIQDASGAPVVLFAATTATPANGRELWILEDLSAAPQIVEDLNLGLEGSNPTEMVVMDNVAYFRCRKDDVVQNTGQELCRSDGTATGTYVLKDVRPGSADSNLRGLTVVGSQLFFFADNGTTGLELWVSDGTETGTQLVKDIYPGATSLNRASSNFNISLTGRYAGTNDTFYFMANDGTTGLELWKSDGTATGTVLVKDIEPGSSGPQWLQQFTAIGDLLVFESYTDATGREPWVSDGTDKGTFSLDLVTGVDGSSPTAITAIGTEALFFADYQANSIFQTGLFRTDGTAGGTALTAKELRPGDGDASIAAFGNGALLNVANPSTFADELWFTDTPSSGPFALSTSIAPDFETVEATGTGFEGDVTPVVLNGTAYFQAESTKGEGLELYRTDGTTGGTEIVQDINVGSANAQLTDFFVFDSRVLLFGANDGTNGVELWSLDGGAGALPTLPYVEDFETEGLGTRYTASNTFYDGSNDHFQRTDGFSSGQVVSNVSGPYAGYGGTYFFAGEDLDDGGGDTQPFKTLTLQEVDVSGASDLRFSGSFAAGCNEGEQFSCYDLGDSLVVRYSTDGGSTYTTALQFSYKARVTDSGSLDGFNEPLARDFDFDGDGQGPELGPGMQTFGFDIPTPASSVIIQVKAHMNGAAEEFAFDDLTLEARPSSVTLANPIPDATVPNTRSEVVDLQSVFSEAAGRDLTFGATSSEASVASVSVSNDLKELLVTGESEGTATVTVFATSPNGDEAQDTFTVTVTKAPPAFQMDARIAFADDFCSDLTDPSTCGVIGTYRFSQPRSDTLSNVNAGAKVLVRYVARSTQNTDLTGLSIEDADRGTVATGQTIAAFDSVVVNRIYDAPMAVGLDGSVVTATATTSDGVAGTRRDAYAIDRPAPDVRMNTRIAFAEDFCSDLTDPSTCSTVGAWDFRGPRSDTLANADPGRKVLVRYIATNRGTTDLEQFDITDADRGIVASVTGANVEPFDSLVVNQIFDPPATAGLSVTRVDVAARDAGGNEGTDATAYGIDVPTPEVRMETRIAQAGEFCSDVTDASTCGAIGAWSASGRRSDTLSVSPTDPVLIRYILTNTGPSNLTGQTLTDAARGLSINESQIVERFDSLVVNRIYDAPSAPGLTVSSVEGTGTDAGGNSNTGQTVYGIDVTGPEVRMNTRIAFADDFCSDVTDPSTCSVIGAWRFSSPRSDTLSNVNPGEKVLVRYILRNSSSNTLTEADLEDTLQGTILAGESVNVAPFDSVVVNRIYDAPLSTGLVTSRVTGTGRDAGGNASSSTTVYGIDVPAPEVDLNTRIARAENFCSDVTDPSTCGVVGAWDFSAPRSDTLSNADPGEPVLVRYIATNRGTTNLEQFDITDADRGIVASVTGANVEPFDSLVVNKIYNPPAAAGLSMTQVDVAARDAGGNEDTDATAYGIDVPKPALRMNVRVAKAADFCSDVTDPSTCSVVGAWTSTGPRTDTLANVTPSETVLVRYVATNVGRTSIPTVDITDTDRGTVFSSTSADLAPFDSVVVNQIYPGPTTAGLTLATATADVRDAGGNPATPRSDTYGVQGQGLFIRLFTFVEPASRFCTNPFDVSTCSTKPLPKADTAQPQQIDDRELVIYKMVNEGTESLVRHTLVDNVAGTVFQGDAFTVAPLDSSVVLRLYDEVPQIGQSREAGWTAVTANGEIVEAGAAGQPLPVELARFGASVAKDRVTLEWSTASEEDNAGFEVQRYNRETEAWDVLGFVDGAGTTAEPQGYRYTVGDLDPNVYRFRLRQVDVSGRSAVSKEVTTTIALDGAYRFTSPAPNPVRSAARFSVTVKKTQSVRVEMYDVLGRRVATVFEGELRANTQERIDLRADRLAPGAYFLRLVGEGFATTKRVTVVR